MAPMDVDVHIIDTIIIYGSFENEFRGRIRVVFNFDLNPW